MLTLPVLSGAKGHVSTFILIEYFRVFYEPIYIRGISLTEMNLIKLWHTLLNNLLTDQQQRSNYPMTHNQ